MTENRYTVSAATLRRFDKPGPRYTSYPTAVEFHSGVADQDYEAKLLECNTRAREEPLSLYFHLPFCEHRCLFCGCHVVISPKEEPAIAYLDYLEKEVRKVAEILPDRRSVAQLHWGGGTPTYYRPEMLKRLHEIVTSEFTLAADAETAVEVDPVVTKKEHIDTLADLGFNRMSLGVQDFTSEVQRAVDRNQTFEETEALISYARKRGFDEGINIDLIYGLPLQKPETFNGNMDLVLKLRPDRVAVYSFAYLPRIKGHQRKLEVSDLPTPEMKLEIYLTAMNRFLDAGYEPIGMDHFALPDDELAVAARKGKLHRNFMGYTVKPATDMISFGISGISDVRGAFFQNLKKLTTYYRALDSGNLPVERGYVLDDDDIVRRYVITQLMCNFRVEKEKVQELFGLTFDTYFAESLSALDELQKHGFVKTSSDAVSVTEQGRMFVRNACMAFDRYVGGKSREKTTFSRTV